MSTMVSQHARIFLMAGFLAQWSGPAVGETETALWQGKFSVAGSALEMMLVVGALPEVEIDGLEEVSIAALALNEEEGSMNMELVVGQEKYRCGLQREEMTGGYRGPCISTVRENEFGEILIFPPPE